MTSNKEQYSVENDSWEDIVNQQEIEAEKAKEQQKTITDNVILTSDPTYMVTLTLLASLASNSSQNVVNMSHEARLANAKQLAKLFIEDMKNDQNK